MEHVPEYSGMQKGESRDTSDGIIFNMSFKNPPLSAFMSKGLAAFNTRVLTVIAKMPAVNFDVPFFIYFIVYSLIVEALLCRV